MNMACAERPLRMDSCDCPERCVLAGICPSEPWLGVAAACIEVPEGRPVAPLEKSAEAVYVVRAGCIKVIPSRADPSWADFRLPGESCGLQGVFDPSAREAAWATCDSRLCVFPYAALRRRLEGSPPWHLHALLRELAGGVNQIRFAMARMRKPCDARVADFLIDLAERLRVHQGEAIKLDMSRGDVALHLMMAKETLSRALARLCAEGLISVDEREVRLMQPAGLALRASRGSKRLRQIDPKFLTAETQRGFALNSARLRTQCT